MDINKLKRLKKEELQSICEKYSLDSKGTKDVLIQRISSQEIPMTDITQSLPKVTRKPTKKKRASSNFLLTKLHSLRPIINVYKNQYNNFVHQDTNFIFDENTHKVVGKQGNNGEILQLDEHDYIVCDELKFDY